MLQFIREFFRRLYANTLALAMVILAISIVYLAWSLTGLNIALNGVQKELPKTLDRVDRQLSVAQNLVNQAESSGKKFTKSMNKNIASGINSGISSGLVDIPVNTVSNVGNKLTNTAIDTGKTTIGFWQNMKEHLLFWESKKKTSSEEAPAK